MPPAKLFYCKPRIPSKPIVSPFPIWTLTPQPNGSGVAPIPRSTRKETRGNTQQEKESKKSWKKRGNCRWAEPRASCIVFYVFAVCSAPSHSLRTCTFCQSDSAAEDRPRTFTKKSVGHNVFRSNDGRWLFWLVRLGLLFFLLQLLSCSPPLSPLSW